MSELEVFENLEKGIRRRRELQVRRKEEGEEWLVNL